MKNKIKEFFAQVIFFAIVIFLLNSLIDTLKNLDNTNNVMYEVASASNMEVKPEIVPAVAPQNGELVHEIIGEFTAYSSGDNYTPGTVMASTKEVYVGAAACPTKYEFGTIIKVEKVGIFICEDRMAKRFREMEKFDLYMNTVTEAKNFGIKNLIYSTIQ